MIADKMDAVEKLRQRQREEDLERRRQVARFEADELNKATLKFHQKQKAHESQTRARYGRFNNSYAADSLRMAAFGG